jgi:hypothetical protein|tara:strand:- start:916 stop:1116 length:201 start_codon:yes stop_codon:yes gene_type:complete
MNKAKNLQNALKYLVLLRDEYNADASNGWYSGSPKTMRTSTEYQARVDLAIESLKQLAPSFTKCSK